mmetsp:Transcript_19526/g.58837  ORF Transcript_19526/g.58837 Transcript_19526/m.58837 type:complete len:101 (-) Transcript_19526:262-564(-)
MVALMGEQVFVLELSASRTSYAQGPGVASVDRAPSPRDAVEKEPRNEEEDISCPKELCAAAEEPPEQGRREAEAEPTESPTEPTEEPADLTQVSPCRGWP